MSEVLEFAARMSQVVGARPAGTEEEQQASFFIEEVMTQSGLDTSVEEFNCNPNYEMPRIVCCIASIVFAILAICLPLMVVPALIVCAAAAIFYVLEVIGSSPLTNATKGGVSQNVIAKYYPGMGLSQGGEDISEDGSMMELERIDGKSGAGRRRRKDGTESRSARKRKIVILARYDSGRVRAELKKPFLGILDKIHWAEIGGMALIPVALLLRLVTGAMEDAHIAWDIIAGIGAFLALLPVIAYIMHQTASYSEGANNNASGVAVMTEVAKRLVASSKPNLASKVIPDADGLSFSLPAEVQDSTVIAAVPEPSPSSPLPMLHGRDAIAGAGVLPVDTDLIYEEAANGDLEKKERKMAEQMLEGDVYEASPEDTASLPPVKADNSSMPTHNGRPSALSLETQIQNASQEFAKFDDSQEISSMGNNPWARLQNEAADRAGTSSRSNASSPDETGRLKDAQTIMISEHNEQADDPNVPDWFKKGMAAANANKDGEDSGAEPVVHRSKFADALDAAHETSADAFGHFEGQGSDAEASSGVDRSKLDELHARIMGDSADGAAPQDKDIEAQAEAKAARRAKLLAARDAKNAEKEGDVANEGLADEILAADELAEDAEVAATIDAKLAAQAQAQAQAAEEVAEQAAVADRTISFIPVAADIAPVVRAKSASETSSHDPIKRTPEEILDDAASLTGSREAVSADGEERSCRRSISLPSLTVSRSKKSVQNAPLAEDAARGEGEGRTALKNVGGEKKQKASLSRKAVGNEVAEGVSQPLEGATTNFLKENAEADAKAALSSLEAPSAQKAKAPQKGHGRAVNAQIPAMQGTGAPAQGQPSKEAPVTVSTAGSFVQPSQTSNFAPVGDELIANMRSEDIIVEDVDDSDYTENVTHTGAIAGPGYVEMPKSRMHRIKSFFGKKKDKDDSMSFADAVGIDEDFDAREVGKARGGWESFKNESSSFDGSKSAPASGQQSPNSGPVAQNQAISGQLQNQMQHGQQLQGRMQGAPQMQGGPQGMPQQMQGRMQGSSQNLQPGAPQGMQRGQGGQPQGQRQMQPNQVQGQQFPGQMPGQRPMGQQPNMQMQGQRPMQPQAGMPVQGQRPMQGQMPMQYQGQRQMQPNQVQGQQFPGQMQGQRPMGQQPNMQMQPNVQNQPNAGIVEESEEVIERSVKKSRSFSFFRKKNEDGDMNSGAFDDADWNGGAFSLGRGKDAAEGSRQSRRGSSRGQAASGRRRSADEVLAEEAMAEMTEEELMAQDMLDEREQIRNFRSSSSQMSSFEEVAAFASSFSKQGNEDGMGGTSGYGEQDEEPDIGFQTEVWFVALGAELADNAGVKNLLAEHGDEMRGAVVIDIDALGAGDLSLIEEEGIIKRVKGSSRMRRYATKAASALGIKLGTGKMLWRESAAYYTNKRGLLTLHLCGMADGKPAYAGEADDTFDKLSEEKLLQNTAFILELLNTI